MNEIINSKNKKIPLNSFCTFDELIKNSSPSTIKEIMGIEDLAYKDKYRFDMNFRLNNSMFSKTNHHVMIDNEKHFLIFGFYNNLGRLRNLGDVSTYQNLASFFEKSFKKGYYLDFYRPWLVFNGKGTISNSWNIQEDSFKKFKNLSLLKENSSRLGIIIDRDSYIFETRKLYEKRNLSFKDYKQNHFIYAFFIPESILNKINFGEMLIDYKLETM